MKPRILLISHEFYPNDSPNSRILRLLFSGYKDEIDIDVITENFGSSRYEKIFGMEISRVSTFKDKLKVLLNYKEKRLNRNSTFKPTSNKKIEIINRIISYICWPDNTFFWIIPAIKLTKKYLLKRKYFAIISVSHPFSNHIIAMIAKNRFVDTKWIMYMNDPFKYTKLLPVNNKMLFSSLNSLMERRAIRIADKHVCSFELARYYRKQKKTEILKIPVIECIKPPSKYNPFRNEKVIIVFCGSLYKSIRDPSYFLNIASSFIVEGRIEVHIYGHVGDCAEIIRSSKLKCGDGIKVMGFVPKKVADEASEKADILLNLSNIEDMQIPSKLFEYMALRKPIINIVYNEDSTSNYINAYKRGVSIKIDDPNGVHKLREFIYGKMPEADLTPIEEHCISYGSKRMKNILML
jgi:glycosyltransferase involved in cell wall biosynthesis